MKSGSVRKILLVTAGSVFLFSSVMVFKYRLELRAGAEYAEDIAQMVVIPQAEYSENKSAAETTSETFNVASTHAPDEIPEPSSTSISSDILEEIIPQASFAAQEKDAEEIAEKPARVAPIDVDFEVLLSKNQDIVAWIYCPDTPINYPIVQAEDNEYYMHRLLDGNNSYPGTLFMDFRNSSDFSDWNSVIYGHNMRNDSMFGTLPDYKKKSYFESHREIYLLTPEYDYVINVLAGFVTPNNSELYNALRPEDAEKERLLKNWLDSSILASEDYPASEDRMITLSTCSYEYENARFVLVGSLEKLNS